MFLASDSLDLREARIRDYLNRDPSVAVGLRGYKDFWREEHADTYALQTLPQIVANWEQVRDAFIWRNRLIHGRDRCTRNMATPRVEAMIRGTAHIWHYCKHLGIELSSRLPVRRKHHDRHFNIEPTPIGVAQPRVSSLLGGL